MSEKVLLPSAENNESRKGKRGEWFDIASYLPNFIRDLGGNKAGAVSANEDIKDIAKNMTGYPSAWARCRLFERAIAGFGNANKENEVTGELATYYSNLRDEWMGLLALIAIYSESIKVKPVPLHFESGNSFSLSNDLGQVLFEDKDWILDEKEKYSQIQLIYSGDVLVGATSPKILFFPAVSYSELPVEWYNKDLNRLSLKKSKVKEFTYDQLKHFYLLLSKIRLYIETHKAEASCKCTCVKALIDDWIKQLEEVAKINYQKDLPTKGVLSGGLNFLGFFAEVFQSRDSIYQKKDGNFTFNKTSDDDKEIDLQTFLLPEGSFIWELPKSENMESKDDFNVYTIETKFNSEKSYFPLPVTEAFLKEWGQNVTNLSFILGDEKRNEEMTLPLITAERTDKQLTVTMVIRVDSSETKIIRHYDILNRVKTLNTTNAKKKCILWPNFTSPQWNAYYLFTQFIDKIDTGIVVAPLYGYIDQNKADSKNTVPFLLDENEHLLKGAVDGHDFTSKLGVNPEQLGTLTSEKIVWVDNAQVAGERYEVWRSTKPIVGLEVAYRDETGKENNCGYLIRRYPKSNLEKYFDINVPDNSDNKVTVGFDFGSNNSCIYYSKAGQKDSYPVEFENMRVALIGDDSNSSNRNAETDELVFFQNEKVANGQFKSWIHKQVETLKVKDEARYICGGMNCFEPNVDVKELSESDGTMKTNVGKLFYSMKWQNAKESPAKEAARKSFMNTIWLQVVANLFRQKLMIKDFVWSYPAAFDETRKQQAYARYERMLKAVKEDDGVIYNAPKTNVLCGADGVTESRAVLLSLKYAGDDSCKPSASKTVITIDIGGSTTDMLVWYWDNNEKKTKSIQSSLAMAADVVTSLFKTSAPMRQRVVKFQEANKNSLSVVQLKNLEKEANLSYYYINSVLDQLGTKNCDRFYSFLADEDKCKTAFAVPAYISGVLSFYAGMLLKQLAGTVAFDERHRIEVFPVGKGSLLFNWINLAEFGSRDEFLKKCFAAGYEGEVQDFKGIRFHFDSDDGQMRDPKAAVAKGLACYKSNEEEMNSKLVVLLGEKNVVNMRNDDKILDQSLNLAEEEERQEAYSDENFRLQFKDVKDPFPNFKRFMEIFFKYVERAEIFLPEKSASLTEKLEDLELDNVVDWVQQLYEFAPLQKKDNDSIEYKESLFILEAKYFLIKYLLKAIV